MGADGPTNFPCLFIFAPLRECVFPSRTRKMFSQRSSFHILDWLRESLDLFGSGYAGLGSGWQGYFLTSAKRSVRSDSLILALRSPTPGSGTSGSCH